MYGIEECEGYRIDPLNDYESIGKTDEEHSTGECDYEYKPTDIPSNAAYGSMPIVPLSIEVS